MKRSPFPFDKGSDGTDTDDEDAPLYLADPRPEAELRAAWFAEYQGGVEKKLIDVCAELEQTVKETLLPATGEPQGKVFFRKMLANPISSWCSSVGDRPITVCS